MNLIGFVIIPCIFVVVVDGLAPPLMVGSTAKGVTSGLISTLAVAALKLRLAEQTGVKCDVTASSTDLLLKGRVGPVTVKGRGWGSPLGLTCRAIEATVGVCELDIGRVIQNQKLVLTTPAQGKAMIAMTAVDFGNFITHPLMKPPGLGDQAQALVFSKENVKVDPSTGIVTFYGDFMDEKWKFELRRGTTNGAIIDVSQVSEGTPLEADAEEQLTEIISDFFNKMVFELDGTFLSFQDMMITEKGDTSPSLMLSLRITVKKFPSPGLAF